MSETTNLEPNPFTATLPVSENPFSIVLPVDSVNSGEQPVSRSPFVATVSPLHQTQTKIVQFGCASALLLLILLIGYCIVGGIVSQDPALIRAIDKGKPLEDIKRMISRGANVNSKAKDKELPGFSPSINQWIGYTPLHLVACSWRIRSHDDNLELAKHLIEHGADIHAKDNFGGTPLHNAAGSNDAIVMLLVSKGADINARDDSGLTPLAIHARKAGSVEGAQFFVSHGTNINTKDNDGQTLLHAVAGSAAKSSKQVELAKYLVSLGLDASERDNNGKTPLDVAKEKNNIAMIEYFSNL